MAGQQDKNIKKLHPDRKLWAKIAKQYSVCTQYHQYHQMEDIHPHFRQVAA
jgi:hypothetical protein